MCFNLTMGTVHKIAKEDVEVYKLGKCVGANFKPIFRDFLYIRDTKTEDVRLLPFNRKIEEGYHALDLLSAYALRSHPKNNIYEYSIGIFIIPKGTEYYRVTSRKASCNITEFVSSNIIYKGEL